MFKSLKRLHLLIGFLSLLAFLATGLVMHFHYDHLRGMDDARRLQFRSTHIYLLFGALINLGLGMYLQRQTGVRRWVQCLGSLIVLTTPAFALAGFFIEPWLTGLERNYSRAAAYGCLAGMMLHFLCWLPRGSTLSTDAGKIAD